MNQSGMEALSEDAARALESQLEALITASQDVAGARAIICGPDFGPLDCLLSGFTHGHERAAHLAAVAVGMLVINGDAQVSHSRNR